MSPALHWPAPSLPPTPLPPERPASSRRWGFKELDEGRHFVAGLPVTGDFVFVHGQIRSGRTPEQKRTLLGALVAAVTGTLGVRRRAVWVYLVDLPPTNMLEFGHVLPILAVRMHGWRR